MEIEQDIFEEVEHWLTFIHVWESEEKKPVPDNVLILLDLALEKALSTYRQHKEVVESKIQQRSLIQ